MSSRGRRIFEFIFLLYLITFLTSCANNSYFVIENKSPNDVYIELVYDSLDLNEIIARDMGYKRNLIVQRGSPEIDSIKKIVSSKGREYIIKYFYDSISSFYLIHQEDELLNDFQIDDLNKEKPYHSTRGPIELKSAFSYYNNDSALIRKIIYNNTISVMLPANFSFYKQCYTCGDCSCSAEDAFPDVKEVRIITTTTLTPSNFKQNMRKSEFDKQEDSYVYTIN